MKAHARPLPVDFAELHCPNWALAAVFAAHVAYPATVVALLVTFVSLGPPIWAMPIAWTIAAAAWVVFGLGFFQSRFLGPAQVWRHGDHLEARIVASDQTDDGVHLRVRYTAGGIARIANVVAPPQVWPDWSPESVTIAHLDGQAPLFVSVDDPWASVQTA